MRKKPKPPETATVWIHGSNSTPRPVTIPSTWRTFCTADAFAQAEKDGARMSELQDCYGIYRYGPKERKK